ncbi:MAG: DUF1841 family protein [Deltaproteobacteria bacterium]|nr:DUF1841 family protein [Deltaproteobacteria bacterium]
MHYDPLFEPEPESWMQLDEQERIALVLKQHARTGAELPNAMLHAAIHAVVENQLAMNDNRVRHTLDRLLGEGLDRHDAIHAIGSVLAEQLWRMGRGAQVPPSSEGYYDSLTKLSAAKWRTAR